MKTKTLKFLELSTPIKPQQAMAGRRCMSLCLIPANSRAQGIGDLLLLLHTITTTLQGPIGDALTEMRKVNAAVNTFCQQIICEGSPDQPG